MSVQRVAAWFVGLGLLGAWFASAAGLPRVIRTYRAPQRPADAVALDHLAADVQAQAGRLRTRLASAPAPQAAIRNPFTFAAQASTPRQVRREITPVAVEAPRVLEAPEPALQLIGVAEDKTAAGLVRTAMISTAENDLVMVTAGQRILGLYEVVAVGVDAVELKHVTTGATRRLALR